MGVNLEIQNWNPLVDMDINETVNVEDIVKVAKNNA